MKECALLSLIHKIYKIKTQATDTPCAFLILQNICEFLSAMLKTIFISTFIYIHHHSQNVFLNCIWRNTYVYFWKMGSIILVIGACTDEWVIVWQHFFRLKKFKCLLVFLHTYIYLMRMREQRHTHTYLIIVQLCY